MIFGANLWAIFNPIELPPCSGTRLNRLTASSARRLAALPSLRELRLGSWGAIEERAFKELVEFANGKGWDILITRNKRPMQQQQADGLAI